MKKKMCEMFNVIVEYNNPSFNEHKAIEEMGELTTALMQRRTKPAGRNDQEVIDEIGDVLITVIILAYQYGIASVKKRMIKKLKKKRQHIKLGKYQNV